MPQPRPAEWRAMLVEPLPIIREHWKGATITRDEQQLRVERARELRPRFARR